MYVEPCTVSRMLGTVPMLTFQARERLQHRSASNYQEGSEALRPRRLRRENKELPDFAGKCSGHLAADDGAADHPVEIFGWSARPFAGT